MDGMRTWAGVMLAIGLAAGLAYGQEPAPLPAPKAVNSPAAPPAQPMPKPTTPKSVVPTNEPAATAKPGGGPVIMPYANGGCGDGCAKGSFSCNWLGRLGAWLTYRPLCATTPCDCGVNNCRPPLFAYFQCSPFHKRYEALCCDTGCGGRICGLRNCGPKGPLTISLTLPSFSVCRAAPKCETSCDGPAVADVSAAKPAKPAGPVLQASTEAPPVEPPAAYRPADASYAVGPTEDSGCTSCRRGGLFRGWFNRCGGNDGTGSNCSGGGCAGTLCARFGSAKQWCSPTPPPTRVDLHNLPVIAPDGFKTSKPGCGPHGVEPVWTAPAEATPAGQALIEQARAELKRGQLATARELATEAHKGPYGVRADASALLRSIESAEKGQRTRQVGASGPVLPVK